MTSQKALKRRVRERMTKTGESYTAARLRLLGPARPVEEIPAHLTTQTEAAIRRRTGRGWAEWFAILDAWGAKHRQHTEIARWLVATQDVPGWWSQAITVSYMRVRGLRAPHQMKTGFTISATRTIDAPMKKVRAAFSNAKVRDAWMGGPVMKPRKGRGGAASRYDWAEDGSRVAVMFLERPNGRPSVNVTHERLADAAAAARMKTWWKERLGALRELLER